MVTEIAQFGVKGKMFALFDCYLFAFIYLYHVELLIYNYDVFCWQNFAETMFNTKYIFLSLFSVLYLLQVYFPQLPLRYIPLKHLLSSVYVRRQTSYKSSLNLLSNQEFHYPYQIQVLQIIKKIILTYNLNFFI